MSKLIKIIGLTFLSAFLTALVIFFLGKNSYQKFFEYIHTIKENQVNIKDIMNKTRREVNHNINIESNDIKKLGGWEDFICEKCKKTYNRMPLSGLCTCGGKILISYHGSVSRKCKQ